MGSGLISLLMGFLSRDVKFILLCVVSVGFFGVFLPLMERKKKREEQAWYRAREREEKPAGPEEPADPEE